MNDLLSLIKNLREITGAGFVDCKKALIENNNDIDNSIDYLRKKGLSKASKKSNREAKEGAVGFYSKDNRSIIIKINSETDFAAKSEKFLNFVDMIGNIALNVDANLNINTFLDYEHEEKKISDLFKETISVIGENIILGDVMMINHENFHVNHYVHNPYKSNLGKIISVVVYKTLDNNNEIKQFSRNLCMHIAASKPEAMDIELLNPDTVKKEKDFQTESIKSSGKPENVINKILEGKMKKFFEESTLLNQKYVLDPDKTVKNVIEELPKECNFELTDYKLLLLN